MGFICLVRVLGTGRFTICLVRDYSFIIVDHVLVVNNFAALPDTSVVAIHSTNLYGHQFPRGICIQTLYLLTLLECRVSNPALFRSVANFPTGGTL